MLENSSQNLADDLLHGVKQIGDYVGENDPRRVYYLLERGLIPGFKIGRLWKARKSQLAEVYTAGAK